MPVPSTNYVRYLYSPMFESKGLCGYRIAWENDSSNWTTTSENQLATFTIPGGTVGNPGGLKWVFHAHGQLKNTSGADRMITFRLKLNGATAIGTSNTIAIPTHATSEYSYDIEWTLMGDNDWNLNQQGKISVGAGFASPTISANNICDRIGFTRGNSIVEATWASDIVLTITGQWSTDAQFMESHGYEVIYWPTTPG